MAGNIRIIEPREKFKRVSKGIILDERVDVLTLGVYVKILTLGEKWNMTVAGLASYLGVSADKMRRVLAVLEEVGYLRRTRSQGSDGRFSGWDYEIASEPFTDIAKTPTSEKTDIGKNRNTENPAQLKDYNFNYKTISKEKNIEKKAATFVPPTIDEVSAYCESRHNNVDAEAFVAFYASKGWKVGREPMKDWKAAVITWEKRRAAEGPTPQTPSPRRLSRADQAFENMMALGRDLGIIADKQITHEYEQQ